MIEMKVRERESIMMRINDVDYEMKFNADDPLTQATVGKLFSALIGYCSRSKDVNKDDFEELRQYAIEGVELTEKCSKYLGDVLDQWQEVVGEGYVSVENMAKIVGEMLAKISSANSYKTFKEETANER